jgi:hypothetical protein
MKTCKTVLQKRRRVLNDNLRHICCGNFFLGSEPDKNTDNFVSGFDPRNTSNLGYKWIPESAIANKDISIIYLDPTEPFDHISYFNTQLLRQRAAANVEQIQPVILIDKDFIEEVEEVEEVGVEEVGVEEVGVEKELAGYFNFGPFPCFILQNNHNSGSGLVLITDLIERIEAKSFSFHSSNISEIKDVYKIHNRLFDRDLKRYDNLQTMLKTLGLSNYSDLDNPELLYVKEPLVVKNEDPWYEILYYSFNLENIVMKNTRYKLIVCIHIGNISIWPDIKVILTHFIKTEYKTLYLFHIINREDEPYLKQYLNELGLINYIITMAPNRGMDLGGFFVHKDLLLRLGVVAEILLKFHTKSDVRWRRELLTSMAGSKETIQRNVEHIIDNDSVVIPQKFINNAKTDKYNQKILDFYTKMYNWSVPDSFSAGTVFGLPWNFFKVFWSTQAIHTLGQTFYLFKSHYVTNSRESYAHAWERILSGYLPYNIATKPLIIYPAKLYKVINLEENKNTLLRKGSFIYNQLYHYDKITYCFKDSSASGDDPRKNTTIFLSDDDPRKNTSLEKEEAKVGYHKFVKVNEDENPNIVFHTMPQDPNIQRANRLSNRLAKDHQIHILWLNYEDTIQPMTRSYDLVLTRDKETFEICKNMGLRNIYCLETRTYKSNCSYTIHNLLFNLVTNNNSDNEIYIRVFCGDEIVNIHQWGDYLLARNLKNEIERLGHSVIIEIVRDLGRKIGGLRNY